MLGNWVAGKIGNKMTTSTVTQLRKEMMQNPLNSNNYTRRDMNESNRFMWVIPFLYMVGDPLFTRFINIMSQEAYSVRTLHLPEWVLAHSLASSQAFPPWHSSAMLRHSELSWYTFTLPLRTLLRLLFWPRFMKGCKDLGFKSRLRSCSVTLNRLPSFLSSPAKWW